MVDSTNLPDVDINQIATDLNGKMDRDGVNATASVCIESWHDENGNWYRVYSDGWCEQGGTFTSATGANQLLTFHKPFANTNYTVFGQGRQTTDAGICVPAFNAYTNTQCYYCTAYNGSYYSEPFYWQAKGYIR